MVVRGTDEDRALAGPTTDLVPVQPANLFAATSPAGVVDQAQAVADILKPMLKKAGLIKKIGEREFVEVEGWTLLGNMLGVFPRTAWCRRVTEVFRGMRDGEPYETPYEGWEACVEAYTFGGVLVGRAESECSRGERAWTNREDFALRGMAQTRATSRALRAPLGFVVKLAGLEATAAEEMPSDG